MTTKQAKRQGLMERLAAGPVICAEGYLFELEARGYLSAGGFVPEVVLDFPEAVTELHREFARCGSDVIEAFTYYGHREKMRLIGKEHLLEPLNRNALEIAKKVAAEFGALVCGNICNTNAYIPGDKDSERQVLAMFVEQVAWAKAAGVDFIVAETFSHRGEALMATEVIKEAGLVAVVTMAAHQDGQTWDGFSQAEVARRLEQAGADVVGLNCARGPTTMLPILKEVRAAVSCPVAALPVPYRTLPSQPTFQSLVETGSVTIPTGKPFPVALDPFTCNRFEIAEFTRQAHAMGATYLGVCCGAKPHHIRAMAEALGRRPPASDYSPDMNKHFLLGNDAKLRDYHKQFAHRF